MGSLSLTRDVTEQRKMRAQLLVSDRMASVGTLAAGVAHEINNPLASLIANLDIALRDLSELTAHSSGPETARIHAELKDAREAAERVRVIARDLKVFSYASDELTEPVDVRRVLDSSIRMARNEIKHRARLETRFAPAPPVDANESRLAQVFLNLLINAAQAIPEGRAQSNAIYVSTGVEPDGRIFVEVEDTGVGIPPHLLQHIFTPFFTTKPIGVGTGLGLSICERIIRSLKGELTVESVPGRTAFRVRLPRARADTPKRIRSTPPPEGQAAVRRGRVLVIDDEPIVATAVKRVLAREHDVAIMNSARQALTAIVGGTSFDVIFCDLMMPDLTGMDFYGEMKKARPEMLDKIVFVTGGAFTAAARTFLDEVSNVRIEKPFDMSALRALVNDLVK
jgi:nitrogen-specific signal transduction histidine kinase